MEISIDVSELIEIVEQLKDDNVKNVTLNFTDDDPMMPACVSFYAANRVDDAEEDYGTIFATEL